MEPCASSDLVSAVVELPGDGEVVVVDEVGACDCKEQYIMYIMFSKI